MTLDPAPRISRRRSSGRRRAASRHVGAARVLAVVALCVAASACGGSERRTATLPPDSVVATLAELRIATLGVPDDSFEAVRDSVLARHGLAVDQLETFMRRADTQTLSDVWDQVSRTVAARLDSAQAEPAPEPGQAPAEAAAEGASADTGRSAPVGVGAEVVKPFTKDTSRRIRHPLPPAPKLRAPARDTAAAVPPQQGPGRSSSPR